MNLLNIILRVRNENLFLESFVKHYMYEGVDEIHILDDNSTEEYPRYVANHPNVFVYESTHFKSHHDKMIDAKLMYQHVLKEKSKWCMLIDADEFITTRRNPNKTIRDELESTFKDVDLIKIPWVNFTANGRDNNPDKVLIDTNWRWNHDKRHKHSDEFLSIWKHRDCKYEKIDVKSIWKNEAFADLGGHCPQQPTREINIVDGVDRIDNYNGDPETEIWYHNLREESIERAYLTCNHYRGISKEQMRMKADDSHLPHYRVDKCYELQVESDFPELQDDLLANKAIERGYYDS